MRLTSHNKLYYTGDKLIDCFKFMLLGIDTPVRELQRAYTDKKLQETQRPGAYSRGCLVASGTVYVLEPELAPSFFDHEDAVSLVDRRRKECFQ
ncbi:hypothetical protein [Paenibacillus eucommiae]|uniref:Uncharacterized protein n=1 Tax=Paenibacillus eucommiae TaxID=1355755 RepID=A0ABS4IZR8_9BACL|nr:hypothetical protein [Paenibacillus eucommiae]MBP1992024.1 hypothetical protein [Paenibacillus eucommiae]